MSRTHSHERHVRRILLTWMAALALACVATFAQVLHGAGTPNIGLTVSAPANVLFGTEATVELRADNPSPGSTGYNLSFREVLPPGISYVAGSAAIAPRILSDAPTTGSTTLLWENVSDLTAGASYTLSHRLSHSQTVFGVGNSYTTSSGAYINSDARMVPDFATDGTPITGTSSYTGSATATSTSTITAVRIRKSEPSSEGELLRGVHDHRTVYSLTVTNNSVNPTSGLVVDDFLPAGLEYLVCGATDHTTDAPTNPGSPLEYPGADALGAAGAPAAADCVVPDLVESLSTDPDGAGSMPTAVYTHVRWAAVGTLAAGAQKRIQYVAAIPIRENTLDWNGATAGLGTTPATTGAQAANLDNNGGAETSDEQSLTNYARVSGTYNGVLAVQDEHTLTRTAEDLAVAKSVSSQSITQGGYSTWTLHIRTSEYRYVDNVRVTDTLPDGLCPIGASNHEGTAECAPAAGHLPSDEPTSATEQTNGSWTLTWDQSTVSALSRLDPSATLDITFPTRARAHYQENGADASPVLARDSWDNSVSIAGSDSVRCAPSDPDCTLSGTRIDADEADGTDDTDSSSAGQSAGAPTLVKRVAAAPGGNCATATYGTATAGPYGPGDRVCWEIEVDFPAALDTGSVTVDDFIPPSTSYVASSATAGPDNTMTFSTDTTDVTTDGVVRWNLGTVANGGSVFQVRFSTLVGSPTQAAAFDLKANLAKMSFANTAGTTFPLRDDADFSWGEPQLSLLKGVRDVDDSPAAGNAANTDHVRVQGGNVVTYRIDIDNSGSKAASGIEVWDKLPTEVTCTDVSAISNGGTCNATDNRIEWTGLSLAGKALSTDTAARLTLTYDLTVPSSIGPNQQLDNTAGVRKYLTSDNQSGTTQMIPSGNIDTTLTTTNAADASNSSDVYTATPTLTKSRTTGISESGNAASNEATVGEAIDYTLTFTVPQGITLYGTPDLTDALGTRQTYASGTATATFNGGALPSGVTLSDTGNTVRLTFPATYTNASGSGDDVFSITFTARVDDDTPDNTRTAATPTITNTATATWKDQANVTGTVQGSVSTTIVEPNLGITKANNDADGRVSPGQVVRYTATVSNATGTRVSTAHDLAVVDTLPAGLTPVDGSGNAVADLGSVQPDGGVWDATARTVTWAVTSLAPGATAARRYDAKVNDPLVSSATLTNTVNVTGTSLPDPQDDTGERTSTSAGSPAGYAAGANNTVRVADPTVSKSVSPTTATIGQRVTYTVDVVIPAGIALPDATVLDRAPDGIDVDSTTSITCVSGCPPAITGTTLTPVANADGSTSLGWFLGDIATGTSQRTVRIVYAAHVDDRYEPEGTNVVKAATLTNTANLHWNASDTVTGTPASLPSSASYSYSATQATSTVTVGEPVLAIDKDVSGDADDDDLRDVQPGEHVTFTLRITNSGTTPAYDVRVTDQPDAELTNVSAATGAAYVTDGWTAGDPDMVWLIPGPTAAGGSATLTYTADVVAGTTLTDGQAIDNSGDVGTYEGLTGTDRTGVDSRQYDNVSPDTVRLTMDVPSLSIAKTTGASGYPESATAEVGQSFPWRVVVTNGASYATAYGVDVTDVLPANWTYVANSAVRAPGGAAEPTITTNASGDRLVWTNAGDIAAGGTLTITFSAKPRTASATTPGVGSGHPHVNTASAVGEDAGGATKSAGGDYATGNDTAQGVLVLPTMTVTKTPDGDSVVAGTTGQYQVLVRNTGTGTARGVRVTDTLPAGTTYTAGAATATGLTEVSVTAGPSTGQTTVVWDLPNLAAGAQTTILVPVKIDSPQANGTVLTNSASVAVNELDGSASDTGSLTVSSAPVWSAVSTKSATPASGTTVHPTDAITYAIHVGNTGNARATNTVVTDAIPTGTTYVAGSTTSSPAATTAFLVGGSYRSTEPANPADVQGVRFTLGTVTTGATADLGFRVRVDKPLANGTTITNTATISSDQNSLVVGPVTHTVASAPQLVLTKAADRDTLDLNADGRLVAYTLRMRNDGDANATNVAIVDGPPAGTELTAIRAGDATVDCAVQAAAPYLYGACPQDLAPVTRVRWTFASVTTTVPREVGLTVRVPRPATDGSELKNTATFTSGNGGSGSSSQVTVRLVAKPRLALTKRVTPTGKVSPGATLVYALELTNTGAAAARQVVLDDPIPAGATYVAGTADAGAQFLVDGEYRATEPADPATVKGVRWTVDPLAVDAAITRGVSVRLDAVMDAGSSVRNTASARADGLTPVTAETVTPVDASPTLTIDKNTAVERVRVGQYVTYTVRVAGGGNAPAADVKVRDRLPAQLAFVSASDGGTHTDGVVTWKLGRMGVGEERTVSVVVRVLSTAAGRETIENSASVDTATEGATLPPDDLAEVEAPSPRDATLVIAKRGPARLRGTEVGVWRITVTNTARWTARNVIVADRLPVGLVMVNSTHNFRLRAGSVRWLLGDIPPGGTVEVRVGLHAAREVRGPRTNVAVARAENASAVVASATTRMRRGPFISPAITG